MFRSAGPVLKALALCMLLSGCSNSSTSGSSSSTQSAPQASLSPSTLTFSSQNLGTTSASQTLTLSNTGNAALAVNSITAAGDFAQANTCGSSVAAGASCSISVTFTPSVVGTRTGSVSVGTNASGSPESVSLTGRGLASISQTGGCAETGTSNFPGCLSLSSPTSLVASTTASSSARRAPAGAQMARPAVSPGNFQSQFAAQTAQIAALLDGSDPDPAKTLGDLGQQAITINVGGVTAAPDFCFGPRIYYSNHPDAGMNVNPPIDLNGQIPGGDLGIWSSTDSSGKQACAAAELNYLLSSDAGKTQFVLAVAAEVQYLAGSNFPTAAGQSYDATAAIAQLMSALGVTVNSVTVGFDGTTYTYSATFSVPNPAPNTSGNINCTIRLKHTPGANSPVYSGVVQYGFDDGSNLLAGTTRYQRTGTTHLDISARDSFYPSGSTPQLDAHGELDPNDPNFTMRFSRVGASFDPTSALTAGTFLFVLNINAPGSPGPGSGGLLDTFQLSLPGDGTGSAFYGFGDAAINGPMVAQVTGTLSAGAAVGTIDRIYCMRQTQVSHLRAQFQALTYNSTDGEYEPSTTVTSQIRYAPTSTCQYTGAQWNNGATGGFWYDRHLTSSTAASAPSTPSPIPAYVVADPADSAHPYNLLGDDATWPQALIDAGGTGWSSYVFPTIY